MRKYLIFATVLIVLGLIASPAFAFPNKTTPDYQWVGGFNGTSLRLMDMDMDGDEDIVTNYVNLGGVGYSIEIRGYTSATLGNYFQAVSTSANEIAVGNFDTGSSGNDIAFVENHANPAQISLLDAPTWMLPKNPAGLLTNLPANFKVATIKGGDITAGDSATEIVLGAYDTTAALPSKIIVFRNDGSRVFATLATLTMTAGCNITDLVIGDAGNPYGGVQDGHKDIVAVEICGNMQKIHIFYQTGVLFAQQTANKIISFSSSTTKLKNMTTEQKRFSVAIGDVGSGGGGTADGLNDIVVTNNPNDKINIYYQLPAGGFPDFTIDTVLSGTYLPTDVTVGDMDGDGKYDVVAASNSAPQVNIYYQPFGPAKNTADKTLTGMGSYNPYDVEVGDINGDGLTDVATLSLGGKCFDFLQENTGPIASGITISPSPATRGGNIEFQAVASDSDGLVSVYEWNSSIDDTIYSGSKQDITQSDLFKTLSSGTHIITLRVQDNGGLWSNVLTETLVIYVPTVGQLNNISTPIQIAPRFGSTATNVYAFNVSYPYTPCLVWRDGTDVGACTSASVIKTSCTNGYSFKYPTSMFSQAGRYDFKFSNRSSQIDVGTIEITTTFDVPTLFLNVETSKDVIPGGGNWIKAQLYEIYGCKLTKIGNLTELARYASNRYFTYIDSLPCSKSSCKFAIEMLAFDSPDIGGELYEFTYTGTTTGTSMTLAADKSFYPIGETAKFTATTTGLGEATILFNVIAPPSYSPSGGNLTYNSSTQKYTGELALTQSGTYIINATAVSKDRSWLKAAASATFTVGTATTAQASQTSVSLGSFPIGGEGKQTVTVTNPGTGTITSFRATRDLSLGNSMGAVVSSTTIPAGGTATVEISVNVLPGSTVKTYTGDVILRGTGMNDIPISVTYIVTGGSGGTGGGEEQPPALAGTVTPSGWDISSMAPGATQSQTFIVDTTTGETAEITVNVNIVGGSGAVTLDKSSLDLENSENDVTATIAATLEPGSYTDSLEFEFREDGLFLNKKTVPITFTIVDTTAELVTEAWSKHSRLEMSLNSLTAAAGAGTSLASQIKANVTTVQNLLEEAAGTISEAEAAFAAGDIAMGEGLISTANSQMSQVDQMNRQISAMISGQSEQSQTNLMPLFIVIIVLVVFSFFIFALREGWLPAHKMPWLVNGFKKIGLGSLVEKAEDMTPKPRFAEATEPAPSRPARARTPTTAQPAVTGEQEKIKRQWEEYYKQHPEYAKRVREQYRSYYNRRYK